MQITQKLLQNAKPKEKPFEIRDSRLKGFILRVQPSGSMSFICEYARGKRITIGKANVLTLTQARNKARELLGRHATGEDMQAEQKKPKTFGDFVNDDYRHWAQANMRTGVKRFYELKLYFGFLFAMRLDAIQPYHIEKWRLSEHAKGNKFSTIRRNETTLKAALNKAVEWGFIAVSPLAGTKPVKSEDDRIVAYLDADQERRLIKAVNDREARIKSGRESANEWRRVRHYEVKPSITGFADHLKPMIIVSLNTGLRKGELLSLTWSAVDFGNRVLTVTGANAKSGHSRHIPMNKHVIETLRQWRLQADSAFVFPGINGGKLPDMPKKPWIAVLKAAGITGFRWHDMRHSFASRLVMAGIDLNTVRELLGHSDLTMTLRYAHLAPEHKAAAVKVLEQ
ncbi:conserved hypothetical protein [Candidatus Methylobacter favarea]|uniref:Tyr recombinase domain-containing protein n=1 Tax=Candidatus Methylobacter favarea TaxID=2707345 RepID=A0A8S0WMT7_9GAMM|nr:site-specific integrase [Candidatus Methylobacter favarea]CAA9889972.1 conserved hypothetical protein [Candidatus Methylobacter favarea]